MVVIKAVADIKCAESSLALTTFIAGVRRIVHAESNRKRVAGAVAELLEPYLQVDDLLTQDQMQPDAKKYRQHVLHVETDGSFSIAAIVWLPGLQHSASLRRAGARCFFPPRSTLNRVNERGSNGALRSKLSTVSTPAARTT
jgi:hypothetical protein